MNLLVVKQALINMGYRGTKNDVFLKPVGFALLVVELKPVENVIVMTNIFNNAKNENMIWSHKDIPCNEDSVSGEELYDNYCDAIAQAESEIGLEHSIGWKGFNSKKPFAFKTNETINQLFND